MLNNDLKLNEGLFDQTVELKSIRTGFGEALIELGEENSSVVVLTADLKESTKVEEFANRFPDRFFEVGVAEQNLAAIGAGLGISGKIAFISSYAVFSPGKNWETLRTTAVYNNANIKIAGHHVGIVTGADGATHQATEDLSLMQSLPGLTIFSPCDAIEAKKATKEAARINGPVYLRFSRNNTPIITTNETPFNKDSVEKYWVSENPKATIFATGHMLYQALVAAKQLESEGINTIVANVATIKPANESEVIDLAKVTGKVVTAEDHQTTGGLGSLIAKILAKNSPLPMEFIGLDNTFGESGSPSELLEKYKMDHKAIIESVKKVLQR